MTVDPFETVLIEVEFVKGGFGGVNPIQVGNQLLDPPMGIMLQQVPLRFSIVIKLQPLPKLAQATTSECDLAALPAARANCS